MTPRTAARWRSPTRPTRPAREARDRDADGETQVAERRGSSQFHSVEGACARTTRGRVWLTTTSRKGGRALSRGEEFLSVALEAAQGPISSRLKQQVLSVVIPSCVCCSLIQNFFF